MRYATATPGFFARLWAFLTAPIGGGRTRRIAAIHLRVDAGEEDVRVLVRGGDELRDLGEYGPAVRNYWRAVHLYRHHDEHHKALALLKRIVALSPRDVTARTGLAECLQTLDRRAEAAEQFSAASVLARENGSARAANRLHERAEGLTPRPKVSHIAKVKPVAAVVAIDEIPILEPVEAPTNLRTPRARADTPALPDVSEWPSIPLRASLVVPETDEIEAIEPVEESIMAEIAYPVRATATELALDVEAFLLSRDSAEARTAVCTPKLPARWDAADTSNYRPLLLDELLTEERPTVTAEPLNPLRRAC